MRALSEADRDRMCSLLDAQFEGVTRAQFEADLREKSAAILLRDGSGVIQGFSSIVSYRSNVGPAPIGVVCSGDTIVEPTHWGTWALSRAWIAAAREMRKGLGCGRTVWLLIVSGYRTYRYLPVFWREFVPHRTHENAEDRLLLDALARERFGSAFDVATGVVRLAHPQPLRSHLAEISAARLEDPDVRYFLQSNPGHAEGDELACLCDLRDDNLTRAGRRMVFGSGAEAAR